MLNFFEGFCLNILFLGCRNFACLSAAAFDLKETKQASSYTKRNKVKINVYFTYLASQNVFEVTVWFNLFCRIFFQGFVLFNISLVFSFKLRYFGNKGRRSISVSIRQTKDFKKVLWNCILLMKLFALQALFCILITPK